MTTVVSDSGPFINLATVNQFDLLQRYFQSVVTIHEVYEEVVTQGRGLPGSQELAAAREAGFVRLIEIQRPQLVTESRQSAPAEVSDIDIQVLVLAIEQQLPLLSDDEPLRTLAKTRGTTVSGSIGLLIQACRDGVIPALKPVLDQLIAAGFHLNPQGPVYRDALQGIGET
jgi:uncharacterized protein